LLELTASLAIISLLMTAVFTFMATAQKRQQSNSVIAESNQSARAALEVMTQEIGQAGSNPGFQTNKVMAPPSSTTNSQPVASPTAQAVTLNDICQILPGDWVSIDSGQNYEVVQITATSPAPTSTNCYSSASGCSNSCVYPNTVGGTITGVFQQDHCQSGSSGCTVAEPTTPASMVPPWPSMIASDKQPYASGLLWLASGGQSNDNTLEFFGDINADGVLNYVVYSLYAPSGAQTVTINGTTYTLYTLYRSITPVTFASGATNNPASPMVQNILYNAANKQGPTGQPIFAYPNIVTVGVIPNVLTVVGTVVINLSVAVNPQALETGTAPEYYTMATQIRPLDLAAAIAVNQAGGGKYLPLAPAGLPMANSSNYYQ
jgi:type II secretory pathway pseudopilin PulG